MTACDIKLITQGAPNASNADSHFLLHHSLLHSVASQRYIHISQMQLKHIFFFFFFTFFFFLGKNKYFYFFLVCMHDNIFIVLLYKVVENLLRQGVQTFFIEGQF